MRHGPIQLAFSPLVPLHEMKLRTPLALSATFVAGLFAGVLALPAVLVRAQPVAEHAEQQLTAGSIQADGVPIRLVRGGEGKTTLGGDRTASGDDPSASGDRPQIDAPAVAPVPSESASAPLARRELAERALKYTVYIRAGKEYGSGIVIDPLGRILTSAHVVRDLPQVAVTFDDGTTKQARVLDQDKKLDIAILQVKGAPGAGVLPWASVSSVAMGDDAYAMGAPRKMSFTLSRGIVSHVGRGFDGVRFIQTDVPINSGSSGGPLIDEDGKVIGLLSFVLRDTEGLAFAIPIEYAIQRFPSVLGPLPSAENFAAWAGQPVRETAESHAAND